MAGLSTRDFLLALQPLIEAAGGQTPEEFADASEETWVQYILGDARYAYLVAQITATVTLENRAIQLIADWYAGTVNGGPNNDGMYPLRNSLGIEYLVPSPAKLVSVIAKGDPGRDARTGFTFTVQYHFGPNERFYAYNTPEDQVYVPALCEARALSPATAETVLTIRKEGLAWGTITFGPGEQYGVFVIATPEQDAGEMLTFHAPAIPDASLGDVVFTFVGASNP